MWTAAEGGLSTGEKFDTLLVHRTTYERLIARQPIAPLAEDWETKFITPSEPFWAMAWPLRGKYSVEPACPRNGRQTLG